MYVDVIIPIYNSEKFIGEALESVLMQDRSLLAQIRIIDDGSVDQSLAVIREYQNRYPDLITVHSRGFNDGVIRCRREGIEFATAEFVTFLDSDDQWTDANKLAIMVQFMSDYPEVAYCGHSLEIITDKAAEYGQLPYKSVKIFPDMMGEFHSASVINKYQFLKRFGHGFHVNALLGRREIFRKIVSPDFDYIRNQDAFFNILAAEYGEVGYIPRLMANYRLRGHSVWSSLSNEQQARQSLTTFYKIQKKLSEKRLIDIADQHTKNMFHWWIDSLSMDGSPVSDKFSETLLSVDEDFWEYLLNLITKSLMR